MYDPARRPRHPVTVAELNDASKLRGLATALEMNLDELTCAGARMAIMRAMQTLNSAARKLNT